MRTIVILLSSVFLLASCGTDNTVEIAKIEAMQQQVDSAEMIFLSWNLDSLKRANRAINDRVDQMKTILKANGNEISMDDGVLVADFKAAAKAFKGMDLSVPKILSEIEYSRKQLASLKADIDNGVVELNRIQGYIDQEYKAVQLLVNSVGKLEEGFKRSNKRVNKLGPDVDALIKRLSGELTQ